MSIILEALTTSWIQPPFVFPLKGSWLGPFSNAEMPNIRNEFCDDANDFIDIRNFVIDHNLDNLPQRCVGLWDQKVFVVIQGPLTVETLTETKIADDQTYIKRKPRFIRPNEQLKFMCKQETGWFYRFDSNVFIIPSATQPQPIV